MELVVLPAEGEEGLIRKLINGKVWSLVCTLNINIQQSLKLDR